MILKKEHTHIAFIYFSRSVEEEAKYKRWHPFSHRKNRKIAQFLHAKTTKTLLQTGMPIFHFHEGNQQGSTFGERIAHAFREVFAQGYSRAMMVGNDSPELHHIDWQKSIEKLKQGDIVLGPDHRGGTYLMGLSANHFDYDYIKNLPWQTARLWDALETYGQRISNNIYRLPKLQDANTLIDLIRLGQSILLSRYDRIILLSFTLIGNFTKYFIFCIKILQARYNSITLRAPPPGLDIISL